METAIIPCESESDAGAFLPVEMAQPEPPRARKDGQETTGERPRRERKAPDMEEFDITTGSRARKQRKAPPVLDADVEDLPDLPQQSAEQEQDVLQAADADLPAPAADLDTAIRQFMLGEGPQLGVNDIQRLDDAAVSGLVAKIHPAFLVNLDAAPEELAAAGLLEVAVYGQYKDLTLPLHRYIVDRVIVEWFARLRPTTKSNYLGAIHRVFGGVMPAAALVLPYDEIAAQVDAIIQSSVDSGKMHNPHGSLTVYQGGLARLVSIQLGIPGEQRPVAELTAKHKNDTLAAIEHKCNAGGSSWKLMVQKWKGFAAPSKRVAAVQKGAQTKLITVAELKQVQAIAMMSPIRQLEAILLSMAGLSFLMSRGNRSEILPHLKFFGLNLHLHQKVDGTTRHLLGFALGARLKHDSTSLLKDLAVLQHKDPLLDTHGHLAFVDLGYNFLYGWAQGRDILAHIACIMHGSVAAAHAAGMYRQSDPAVEAEAKPLQWLEYGFLARGKATEAKIAHVTSVLRGLLRDSELKKSVVGHLGRNTLAATLLSEDISSYQTATLMGWSLGDQMQRSYASKTSVSSLPALEAGAGFAPGEVYSVPRSTVDPLQLCPGVYKLFVPDWMVQLREQVAAGIAENGVEWEGARDYLLAREHMMRVLLQNLPFYVYEYGPYWALFRLQVFWAIAGHENGGWAAAAANHPLLDEFQGFAKEVLLAHYGQHTLAGLLLLQKSMMDGISFPVPCPLMAADLPFADDDAKVCGAAFVRCIKSAYTEAIDSLLKMPARASQRLAEASGSGSGEEQLKVVGELREELIQSQRHVIELQQQLLQQRGPLPAIVPWYGGLVPPGMWPPAGYAPAPGGIAAAAKPAQDTAVLGGSGLSRLLMSLESLESSSFQALHARWPAVQQAMASAGSALSGGEKDKALRAWSLWQRVFNGVGSFFDAWQDQQVVELMDSFRASYRPASRKSPMPMKRFLEGVAYALRCRESTKGVGGTFIGGESSHCGTNAEFEAAFVRAVAGFATGKGLPAPTFS
ncbi:hypothetical protein NADE_009286 [Nannochloris sp. 'desiccata']|nr:hypothetical protein KSW81_005968 [Chlorella desiccata (nom. nud.)]KAH7621241.1 hypothetical protein NADE_009286 [Chlorella desiccata (nom. nud.)]